MRPSAFAPFLLLLALPVVGYAQESVFPLFVIVSGGQPEKGQIILSLFHSEENYLKSPSHTAIKSLDREGKAEFMFQELPAGKYSLSAIYDEDSNGELNTGLFGIPTELVGFSNNARGRFGPPGFAKTAFDVAKRSRINIELDNAKSGG